MNPDDVVDEQRRHVRCWHRFRCRDEDGLFRQAVDGDFVLHLPIAESDYFAENIDFTYVESQLVSGPCGLALVATHYCRNLTSQKMRRITR